MPTHASHTSTRTLAANTVAYLFFALPFIFAPVRSMKLLGCRAASIEDLTDMNTHALCLLIMARGVAYFLAAVPIAAATRSPPREPRPSLQKCRTTFLTSGPRTQGRRPRNVRRSESCCRLDDVDGRSG
jgi:hypothetical protein